MEKTNEKEKQKGIPSFDELRKIDLSKHTKQRDKADYINWAVIKQLLHDNGATKVYFEPIQQENGSSLIMSNEVFKDNKENTNRVYETRIRVVIDDLTFEIQGPVMNGSNPVKDNSMTQQRLWNSQTRLFVKGVAIHTGLGFDLWSRTEKKEEGLNEEDLSMHNISKIQERVLQTLTKKMKLGITKKEIASKIKISESKLDEYLMMYKKLDVLEKVIETFDKEQK